MTRTGRIVESGEEGEGADSLEVLQREFRDDGINRDIDMEFSAGYISIPPSYAFEGRLDTLPVELLSAICLYLDVGSLVRLHFVYVYKHFYALAQRTLPSLHEGIYFRELRISEAVVVVVILVIELFEKGNLVKNNSLVIS